MPNELDIYLDNLHLFKNLKTVNLIPLFRVEIQQQDFTGVEVYLQVGVFHAIQRDLYQTGFTRNETHPLEKK